MSVGGVLRGVAKYSLSPREQQRRILFRNYRKGGEYLVDAQLERNRDLASEARRGGNFLRETFNSRIYNGSVK